MVRHEHEGEYEYRPFREIGCRGPFNTGQISATQRVRNPAMPNYVTGFSCPPKLSGTSRWPPSMHCA